MLIASLALQQITPLTFRGGSQARAGKMWLKFPGWSPLARCKGANMYADVRDLTHINAPPLFSVSVQVPSFRQTD